MPDIISKEELDALLEAFPREEPPGESAAGEPAPPESSRSPYARRSPGTDRDRLGEVLDGLTREASRRLSLILKTRAELSPAIIRHVSYEEFVSQLPTFTTLVVVGMPPLSERFILEIEPSLAFPVVERLLGGRGVPYRKPRHLTSLEKRILTRFVRALTQALSAAAHLPEDLQLEIETLQDGEEFAHFLDAHEPVTSASFTVDIGASVGTMRFYLPSASTELLCSRAETRASFRLASHPARDDHVIRNVIGDLKVPVAAYLGKATVTLNDLIVMRQGDVILLDGKAGEGLVVTLHVGRRPKFSASMGTIGSRRAARVIVPLSISPGHERGSPIAMTETPHFQAVEETAFQQVEVSPPSSDRRQPRIYPDYRTAFPPASAAYEGAGQAEAGGAIDADTSQSTLDHVRDIELDIAARLGSVELPLKEILNLAPDSTVTLDRLAADPIDLVVGDRVVAQGEIVKVGEDYGIRITRTFS